MILRYLSVVFLAATLAFIAATGATATEVEEADAAHIAEPSAVRSVSVKSCTGGSIRLFADEKRMLDLHNKTCAEHGLPRLCVTPLSRKQSASILS